MKKALFYLLTFLITLFFAYILTFFFYYISIDEEFKNSSLFKDKKQLYFYKKYSETLNHIRLPNRRAKNIISQSTNLHEMIYTITNKSNNTYTVLLQGDSWIQQISDFSENSNYLKKNLGKNYNIVSAGISSYSPSLMSLQFKLLEEKFKIQPDFLITYIDQTDITDETCRYKNLKKYDVNKNLIAVDYEKYPLFVDPFNIDRIIKLSEISLTDRPKIDKVRKYLNYKIVKAMIKIVKVANYKINKFSISKKCYGEHIEKNLISPSKKDVDYFKDSIREYFIRISDSEKLKKIYVVTHPYHKHITGEYKNDVSEIVSQLSKEFPKINHVNFTDIIKKEKNFYLDTKLIWKKDNIHLKNKPFRDNFIKTIIQNFNMSLN